MMASFLNKNVPSSKALHNVYSILKNIRNIQITDKMGRTSDINGKVKPYKILQKQERQCTYNACLPIYCCHEKAISITVCVWVRVSGNVGMCMCVALLIQHAMHMHHTALSSVASLAPHFLALSHKRHIFWGKSY